MARVDPECGGFRGSRMRKGMRSCISFCRRYVAGRISEFLDLLATARNVVEGVLSRLTTLMSGTLQIVGPDSIQGWSSRRLSGSLESSSCGSGAHCFGNVWALEKRVGARCRCRLQVGAGGCRHRLQQSGSLAARLADWKTDRQMDRQVVCVSRWERCSLRNRKWTRGKKRSVIVQDKRED